jgi:hypothetical protein
MEMCYEAGVKSAWIDVLPAHGLDGTVRHIYQDPVIDD